MSEELRSASESDGPALTDSERAQLAYALRRCARGQGLSASVTDRYQAWIFVFVSWCHEHPPHRVARCRIGAFQEALQRSADAGEEEVYQAMDALAFLFGAADEVASLLVSPEAAPQNEGEPTSAEEPGSTAEAAPGGEDAIRTLRLGWQSGSEASGDTIRAPQIPLETAPGAPLAETTDAGEEEEMTEGASTAELCIERFQMQVESLHACNGDASEQESGPDGEVQPEPNAPSS
jgi:hypothetical protein